MLRNESTEDLSKVKGEETEKTGTPGELYGDGMFYVSTGKEVSTSQVYK